MPPEIVWGFGLGQYIVSGTEIDLPLVEQEVEIEMEAGGDLVLIPRERPPEVNLRPYIDLNVAGSHRLQRTLGERLALIRQGDVTFGPEGYEVLGPIFEQVASQFDSSRRFLSLADRAEGRTLPKEPTVLRVTSGWAIHVRPRSSAVQVQDLKALMAAIDDDGVVPRAIAGFVVPEPDEKPGENHFGIDFGSFGATLSPGEP